MMKTGTKKVLYTFIAVVSALGLGIGAVLVSMLNVQASTEMMPGIEQILDEKSEEKGSILKDLKDKQKEAAAKPPVKDAAEKAAKTKGGEVL